MCDAVSTIPPRTTAGMARPTGPATPICCRTWPTTAAMACGVAGDGVGNRIRSVVRFPVAMSTGAALIPVPPISTPTTRPDAVAAFISLPPGPSADDHDVAASVTLEIIDSVGLRTGLDQGKILADLVVTLGDG